jgi:hypothetical protein
MYKKMYQKCTQPYKIQTCVPIQSLQELLRIDIPNINSLIRGTRHNTFPVGQREGREDAVVVEGVSDVLALDLPGFHVGKLPGTVEGAHQNKFGVRRPIRKTPKVCVSWVWQRCCVFLIMGTYTGGEGMSARENEKKQIICPVLTSQTRLKLTSVKIIGLGQGTYTTPSKLAVTSLEPSLLKLEETTKSL